MVILIIGEMIIVMMKIIMSHVLGMEETVVVIMLTQIIVHIANVLILMLQVQKRAKVSINQSITEEKLPLNIKTKNLQNIQN